MIHYNLNIALYRATYRDCPKCVKLLIEAGADGLNRELFGAFTCGPVECVKHLLEAGATNLDDALPIATQYGHPECVELLESYETKLGESK